MLYLEKYQEDILYGTADHVIDISNNILEESYNSYLPSGSILVVVKVSDSFGGFSNFT